MGKDVNMNTAALIQEGQELAIFLENFVTSNDIPKYRTSPSGERSGGISVLGWSSGCILQLSMLGHAGAISEDRRSFLEEYLRAAIVYGQCTPLEICKTNVVYLCVQTAHALSLGCPSLVGLIRHLPIPLSLLPPWARLS